jgi:hypothetical protein
MRGAAALAQEMEKLDAFAQPPLSHLRPSRHLRDDRRDLGRAQIEAPVEALDRIEDFLMRACGPPQRAFLPVAPPLET